MNIYQYGKNLRQSRSLHRLDSVNEIGKVIPANEKHKRIVNSRRSYDTQVVVKLTEQYDRHVLTLMQDAEQTQTWNKENWIDARSRSADTQNGVL